MDLGHADKLKHGGKEYVYEKGALWTGRYYVKSYNEIV